MDEVGDMSSKIQARVLRAIEESEIQRIGGTEPIDVDVRIIAASNRDLRKEVKEKRFREDLYFRLSVLTIHVPPLRERKEDIPLLTDHFLKAFCAEIKRPLIELDPIRGQNAYILCGSRKDIVYRFLMQGTVRTSYTVRASAEGIDNPSREGKGSRLDEPTLMLDEDSPVMRGERGHDVLPFQFPADEVFGPVELDTAVTVDLANPRDQTFCNRQGQMTPGVKVWIEREAVREMAEGRPGPIAKNSGEPGPVVGQGEASAGLLDVVVAEEAVATTAQSPQIGTRVKMEMVS